MIQRIPGADAFCIALVILPICIVPTVISERFRPKTYPAREKPPVVVKLQDRIHKEKNVTEPASIRYKNPGAMWGSSLAIKWGAEKQAVTLNDGKGQGNNIAVFPTYVAGICAQLDLWRTSANYKNKRFEDAIRIWCGGNSVESYISFVSARVNGLTRSTIMNDTFWRGPMCIPFLKAQAWHEAGKPYPALESDWVEAQKRVMGGIGAVQPPLSPIPDVPPTKPKVPAPVAPKAAAVGVLGAALLGTWHFIQTHPVPTVCGLAIAISVAVYLLKRK